MVDSEYGEGELPGSWHSQGRPVEEVGWIGDLCRIAGLRIGSGEDGMLCMCGNDMNCETHRLEILEEV